LGAQGRIKGEAVTDKISSAHEDLPTPELSDAFRAARKHYVLVSALLTAWELIGFDITETPLEGIGLKLKSPQAVPYVLVVLVLYFSFRTMIEWYQCDSRRRSLLASKVDLYSAHFIAILSFILYITQSYLGFQLADELDAFDFIVLCFYSMAGDGFIKLIHARSSGEKPNRSCLTWGTVLLGGIAMLVLRASKERSILGLGLALFGFLVGVSMGHVMHILNARKTARVTIAGSQSLFGTEGECAPNTRPQPDRNRSSHGPAG
jgi:hypothetical protein